MCGARIGLDCEWAQSGAVPGDARVDVESGDGRERRRRELFAADWTCLLMAAPRLLSPPLPGSPPSDSSPSVRSISSLGGFSSSSSLASAFSDLPPPLSIGPKTGAFFASPFSSTRSGPVSADSTPPTPPRSLTADFFATPVSSPPPPRRAKSKVPALPSNIHPSRIFPSRYTACLDDDGAAKQFIEVDGPAAFSALSLPSTTNPLRLPTPPPPSSPLPPRHLLLSDDEPTPRPPHLEPALFVSEPRYVDPSPGCIITSDPPCISNPPNLTVTLTPPPSNTTFADSNFEILSDSSHSEAQLRLIRPLGQGAFSSVWLAQDKSLIPLTLRSRKSVRELRKKASIASLSRRSSFRGGLIGICSNNGSAISLSRQSSVEDKQSLRRDGSLRMKRLKARLRGTKPVGFGTRYVDERHGEMGIKERASGVDPTTSGSDTEHNPLYFSPPISASTSSSSAHDSTGSYTDERPYTLKKKKNSNRGRLVAVKLTPRKPAMDTSTGMTSREREEEEERTRVGFVREVEILKHVSHPNITVLLEHMSTPSHHMLVLPYLPGGDLLGLVNSDIAWSKLGESVLRRIWCELCKAVGWMHGVGLVHRDIKLENILLTTQCFSRLTTASPCPTLDSLPTPPTPLIKLSDFGLSRFIEIDERTGEGELLWTRCGSEAYAAPELVVGTGSARAQAAMKRRVSSGSSQGGEGGRSDHDDEAVSTTMTSRGFYDARETDAWACGVVLYALVGRKLPFGEGVGAIVASGEEGSEGLSQKGIGGDGVVGYGGRGYGGIVERRQWLMRIARGEYEWPLSFAGAGASGATASLARGEDDTSIAAEDCDELVGQQLVECKGVQRIVARLLVRDPRKRARIMDLWDDDWMWGSGGGFAIGMNQVEWKERERDQLQQQQQTIPDSSLNVGCGDDGLRPDEEVDEGVMIDGYYADEGSLREGEGEGEDGNVEDAEEVEEVVDGEEGWLLDQEGIGSVARQEVV